jgi:epoxyqueuosine reductase
MHSAARTRQVTACARVLGFDLCGVAPAEKFPELEHLPEWLERGYAGEMHYLHNPKRLSPQRVLSGARSVIVCAMNYNAPLPYSIEAHAGAALGQAQSWPRSKAIHTEDTETRRARRPPSSPVTLDGSPFTGHQSPGTSYAPRGWISRYAWGDDYHAVLGARLRALVEWMHREWPEPHQSRWYVDTGPVLERVAAKWAGLGWLGKNTCLINKDWGSWLFLGVVITTLELEPSLRLDAEDGKEKSTKDDSAVCVPELRSHETQTAEHQAPLAPLADLCGQCTLCLEACPTGALVEPYVLDARRCISYLTIELRGAIPAELHEPMGWHIFGCDICQDVCPYNRKAPVTDKVEFMPRVLALDEGPEKGETHLTFFAPPVRVFSSIPAEGFERTFAKSALRRAKRSGLERNAAVALSNQSAR